MIQVFFILNMLLVEDALRPSFILIVNMFSLYTLQNKKIFYKKKFVDFQNLIEIKFCPRVIFETSIIH